MAHHWTSSVILKYSTSLPTSRLKLWNLSKCGTNREFIRCISSSTRKPTEGFNVHFTGPLPDRGYILVTTSQLLIGNVYHLDRSIFVPVAECIVSEKPLSTHTSKILKMQYSLLKASASKLRTDHLVSAKQLQTPKFCLILSDVLVQLQTSWRGPMRVVSGSNARCPLYDLVSNKWTDLCLWLETFSIRSDCCRSARRCASWSHGILRWIHSSSFVNSSMHIHTSAEFSVKWPNYPDPDNSWEPYSSMNDVVVFHDFLKLKKLHRLLKGVYPIGLLNKWHR